MSDDLVKRLRDVAEATGPNEARQIALDAADRIEELEAKLAKAVDVIDWALICWDDHNKHGYMMQGDWVPDARTTLAELKGEK
jgi:hypothetical protein